jgi:hypothetical protein
MGCFFREVFLLDQKATQLSGNLYGIGNAFLAVFGLATTVNEGGS